MPCFIFNFVNQTNLFPMINHPAFLSNQSAIKKKKEKKKEILTPTLLKHVQPRPEYFRTQHTNLSPEYYQFKYLEQPLKIEVYVGSNPCVSLPQKILQLLPERIQSRWQFHSIGIACTQYTQYTQHQDTCICSYTVLHTKAHASVTRHTRGSVIRPAVIDYLFTFYSTDY